MVRWLSPSHCNYKPHRCTDMSIQTLLALFHMRSDSYEHTECNTNPYYKFFLFVNYLNFPPLQSRRYRTDNLPQKSAFLGSIPHTFWSSYLPHSPALLNHSPPSSSEWCSPHSWSKIPLTTEMQSHVLLYSSGLSPCSRVWRLSATFCGEERTYTWDPFGGPASLVSCSLKSGVLHHLFVTLSRQLQGWKLCVCAFVHVGMHGLGDTDQELSYPVERDASLVAVWPMGSQVASGGWSRSLMWPSFMQKHTRSTQGQIRSAALYVRTVPSATEC